MYRFSALFIILTVCFWWNAEQAFSEKGQSSGINPVYEHLFKDKSFPPQIEAKTYGTSVDCASYAEFKAAVKEKYEGRVTSFSIHLQYDFSSSQANSIVVQAHNEIIAEDDYLHFSYSSYETGWSGIDGDVVIDFQMTYLTTYDEEQYVSQKVAEILGGIIISEMDDEQKEKEIHDWIVLNVQYDTDRVEYTAYSALFLGEAVCQGYSLLTFKMLQEAGIEARIISGFGSGEGHMWNMVNLCGNWYHLDVTWSCPR